MPKEGSTIAIYSRKSKVTGKGESIANQVELCRDYLRTHFGEERAEHAIVFEEKSVIVGIKAGSLHGARLF